MGLQPDVFDDMTPADFYYAWTGWRKLEEQRQRSAWERERWSTYFLLLPHIEAKSRNAIADMLSLPWDEKSREGVSRDVTMDERKAVAREMLKLLENGRKKDSGLAGQDRGG